MKYFHDLFDMAENLQRWLASVSGLRGVAARSQAVILLLIAAAISPFLWYLDLDTTSEVMVHAVEGVTAGAFAGWNGPIYALNLLLPTMIEIGLSRFALRGSKVAEIVIVVAKLFDVTTDWPRVQQVVNWMHDHHWFAAFGLLDGAAYYATFGVVLLLATTLLELLFVCCVICGIVCLKNSMEAAGGNRAQATA